MAKIKFGAVVQDARGKLDGVVYSRNASGAYVRQKVSPVQPQTARQTLVRERLTTLSKRFSTVLTAAQILSWNAFAKVNPVVDIFGNSMTLSGIAMYTRLNGIILNAGSALIDTPPSDLEVGGLLSVTVTATAGPSVVSIAFTGTPLAAGTKLYVWASTGLNAGRHFFKPSLRFVGVSAAAQASPYVATVPYTAIFGDLIAGTAVGFLVGVCDPTKGAVTPGIFQRVIIV